MTDERSPQRCATCSSPTGEEYALVLHEADGTSKDLTMALCETCSREFFALEWIERRRPA